MVRGSNPRGPTRLTSVMRLTAEAILEKSKAKALKALLADPVVDNAITAEKMLDNMIEIQKQHLGYLI